MSFFKISVHYRECEYRSMLGTRMNVNEYGNECMCVGKCALQRMWPWESIWRQMMTENYRILPNYSVAYRAREHGIHANFTSTHAIFVSQCSVRRILRPLVMDECKNYDGRVPSILTRQLDVYPFLGNRTNQNWSNTTYLVSSESSLHLWKSDVYFRLISSDLFELYKFLVLTFIYFCQNFLIFCQFYNDLYWHVLHR